jgi:hypothetical protein
MPPVNPAWAGEVQFYELLFGTWTVYVFLVLVWQKLLRAPLEEWRYVMITFLGATAYWVNHYFQHAPFWLPLINIYALEFFVCYWLLGIAGRARSLIWKISALLTGVAFTVVFILFEQLARYGQRHWGMHEFCWMCISALGFLWLIWWRGHTSTIPTPKKPVSGHGTQFRGLGGSL